MAGIEVGRCLRAVLRSCAHSPLILLSRLSLIQIRTQFTDFVVPLYQFFLPSFVLAGQQFDDFPVRLLPLPVCPVCLRLLQCFLEKTEPWLW